ncbi:uncharacterized protein LOC129611471 [Condylostylus longicornis]|uniref:uncharacterized protein LOC129611471 n=1 Tax=Condylostylus longicornis TaxID=2530218 RepID=UPI00244DCEC6|nr:uncharacterized protein LOC129611471 [Condylostylus longicornis]
MPFHLVLCTIFNITIAQEDPCLYVPDSTFISDHESCGGWIRCNNGKSSKGKCPEGLRFDSLLGVCDLKEHVPCIDDLCNEETEGQFFADERKPRKCSAYILCYKGVAESYDCPDGLSFDKKRKVCDYKENVECTDEENSDNSVCSAVPNDILLRNEHDCSKYWECQDHKAIENKCDGTQLYNQRIGKCDDSENVDCEITCHKFEEGIHKRNPKSCRSYFKCENEKPVEVNCKDYEFVVDGDSEEKINTLKCEDQMNVSNDLCPNRCEGRADATFVPIYTDNAEEKCKRYHPCKDGRINGDNTIFTCPADKFLNDETQKCVVNDRINRENCRNPTV